MTNNRNNLNENFLSDIGQGLKSIADIPIIRKAINFFSGDEEEDPEAQKVAAQEKEKLEKDIEKVELESVPLNRALESFPDKSAIILGSSQAGVLGHPVMRALEMRGFNSFDFKPIPAKTMSFVYASTLARIKNKSKFDVAVIFPGFKAGERIDSVIDVIEFFTPSRCFVVIPPPVTNITNTIEASRLGLNKGMAVPPDFWFALRKGMYASEREDYCESLKQAVISAGATAIDPRDVVNVGSIQASGVRFPDSPDGIHPSQFVGEEIADAVGQAIMDCTFPVPAADLLARVPPDNQMAAQRVMPALSNAPASQALLAASAVTKRAPKPEEVPHEDDDDVESSNVSSGFGKRKDPFTGLPANHQGLDISVKTGTEVKAALSGTVTRVIQPPGHYRAGSYVEITHANNDVTRYLHLSKVLVTKGQTVNTGDVIALSGSTGRSTGPHLHWETWEGGGFKVGRLANPIEWLSRNPGSMKPVNF